MVKEYMNRFRKAVQFYRMYGLKAFLLRIKAEIQLLRSKVDQTESDHEISNINNIVQKRFISLNPLKGFSTAGLPARRLNLVTDSINTGSLFGGVGTSFILSTLLANRWGCELRIITRTEAPQRSNYYQVLEPNKIPFPQKAEFEHAYFLNPKSEISTGPGDIFLTTSWWTTWSVRKTFGSKRIIYLLQEDERAFYPYGDDHLRCSELMLDPNINFVINTRMLYNYLISEGFQNLVTKGVWFEPAWPEHIFFMEDRTEQQKKNFFFYARPNNIRNLFYRGLEVIEGAMIEGVLDPDEWNFHFTGKDIPMIRILGNPVQIHQNLNWSEYAALIRKMDLGLSLMYTPHPSYPPLDLAASGAIVVTNRFGPKRDLHQYSKNILCCDQSKETLVEGLREGSILTKDWKTRVHNYQNQQISRDWQKSFEKVLDHLDRLHFNV